MTETRGQIYYILCWQYKGKTGMGWRYVHKDGMLGAMPEAPPEIHEECISTMQERKRKLESKYPSREYRLTRTQSISLTEIL